MNQLPWKDSKPDVSSFSISSQWHFSLLTQSYLAKLFSSKGFLWKTFLWFNLFIYSCISVWRFRDGSIYSHARSIPSPRFARRLLPWYPGPHGWYWSKRILVAMLRRRIGQSKVDCFSLNLLGFILMFLISALLKQTLGRLSDWNASFKRWVHRLIGHWNRAKLSFTKTSGTVSSGGKQLANSWPARPE